MGLNVENQLRGKVNGVNGANGNGIASIVKTGTSGLVDTYTINFTDGNTETFTVTNGAKGDTGDTGNGISSVQLNNDYTLTINYTNGESYTTTSIRGQQGEKGDKPTKGVDYFTNEEIEEFKDDIVNGANSEFNENVTEKMTAFNSNATSKTNAFNTNAADKTDTFDGNASTKTSAFNSNATSKTSDFDTNATNKTTTYNQNATTKTSEYNTNAQTKLEAYNTNATEKITAYNENAEEKIEEYNDNASALMQSVDELEAKHDTEVAELNEKITELETDLEMATDLIPTDSPEISDNITLSDSARYYFKKIVPGGKSEQETFTGKNLAFIYTKTDYNYNSTLESGELKINGTSTSAGSILIKFNSADGITLKANKNYILSVIMTGTVTGSGYKNIYLKGTNIGSLASNTTVNYGLSPTENYKITNLNLDLAANLTFTNFNIKVQIEEGSTATEYEKYVGGQPAPNPDYECPIQNVTGNVEVKVENKNLLNMSALVQGIYNSSSSAPTMPPVLGSINDKRYRSFSTTLKAGTYTICFDKANSILRDFTNNDYSSNNTMGIGVNNITNATFTIAESSTIYISFRKYDGTDWSNNDLVWLVSGSTSTEFIEHEEQTVTFPLSEGQVLHEGDTIEDKIVQRRKTVVFDGTEEWGLTNAEVGQFKLAINDMTKNPILCNYFGYKLTYSASGKPYLRPAGGAVFAEIGTEMLEEITVNAWKAFLAEKYANGTPVTLEYELETPIETEFTEAQITAKAQIDKLYSYKGTTHITSNANLDVTYRKDIEAMIDNLSNAIVALGGV